MKFVFFRTPKPRRFEHIPIYYDERKERLKKMEEAAKKSSERGDYDPTMLKGEFKKQWTKSSIGGMRQEKRKSNVRVVAIIAILVLIAYYLMKADFAGLSRLYE